MRKMLRQLLHYLMVDPDVKKVAPAQPNSTFHHGLIRDDNKYATGNALLQSVKIISENIGQEASTSVSCCCMSISANYSVDGIDQKKFRISKSDNKGE
jgi:hypothetical protein